MRISIQEYTEKLEVVLEPLDRGGVCDLVRKLARDVPVEERDTFLQALAKKPAVAKDGQNDESDSVEEILEALMKEIKARAELIENGEYDELDDWSYEDYDYYRDEEPPCLTEDHEAEIKAIIQEADNLFLDREFNSATRIYKALIRFAKDLKEKVWEPFPADLHPLAQNYCQAVFESSTDHSFPSELLSALFFVRDHLAFNSFFPKANGLLFLRDVFPDAPFLQDASFLKDWLQLLEERPDDPLKQMLTIEALLLWKKEAEVLAYLDACPAEEVVWGWVVYIHCQMRSNHWKPVPAACRKAYPLLEDRLQRSKLGEWMQQTGEALNQQAIVAAGIRYRFVAYPSMDLLGELLVRVSDQTLLMKEWILWIGLLKDKSYHEDLNVLLRLFLGDFRKICTPSRSFAAVGWSNGSESAVLVVSIWISLCGKKPLPPPVNDLFSGLFHIRSIMLEDLTEVSASQKALKETLRKSLASVEMTPDEKLQWLEKTRKVVEKRVNTIVSNKHRGAYDRAAEAIVAWCAVAKLLGKEQEARGFIEQLLLRYSRFSAFKRELNERI